MSAMSTFNNSRGMAVRMVADTMLVNLGLAAAIAVRYLIEILFEPTGASPHPRDVLWSFVTPWWQNAPIVTLICLTVFSKHGFYTYSEMYVGRFKPLVISRAVGLSFLLVGVLAYLFWDLLGIEHIPRGSLLMAAVFSVLLCLAARTCSFLWEKVLQPDRKARIRSSDNPARSVLVIGGAGYIGSALLPKLLNKGMKVRVLDRFLYGFEPVEKWMNHPRLELVEGDFRHVDRVVEAMQDMDSVVHLGAIVGDPASSLDEAVTVAVNLTATQMIAQVAKACGIRRFVFASTCSVYGASDDLLNEQSAVNPISLYGRTKLAAERGLMKMTDDSFQPTILRFATIYGFSGRTRFDLVVNLLAAMAQAERKITVYGGDQWRPFVHVDDAALAVATVLGAPLSRVGNQKLNIGSDEQNYTIRQIGELIHQKVMDAELIVKEDDVDKRNYRVSFAKVKKAVNFQPKWNVERGIEQVLEAVAGGAVTDFRDKQYSNVKFLKEEGLIDVLRANDDWTNALIQGEPDSNDQMVTP